jgi:hypothetical protein
MTYAFATLRTQDDNDSSMFPAFSGPSDPYVFELQPDDGTHVTQFVATALKVHELRTKKTLLSLRDIKGQCFLTDARFVFCCEKYDKGGGWVGFGGLGAAVAITANAVSKARAAHRRKGKMLAGQVRYQWLAQVGGSTKMGMLDSEQLRLVVADGTRSDHPLLLVDLTLPKATDSAAVAQELVRRSSRFRLAHDVIEDGDRAEFERLTAAPRIASEKGKFGMHVVPRYWLAKASTSRLPVSA